MILVTGATGTVGRYVLEGIAAADLKVRALVRDLEKARSLDLPLVEFVPGDLADPATLGPALTGVDRIVLISAFSPDMARLQGNLVDAAARSPERPRIVKLSGMGADPNGPILMNRLHGEAERWIIDSGLPWTFVRPTLFMQNFLRMAQSIRLKHSFSLPAGNAAIAQVDVRDIAAVILRVLVEADQEGKIYELTGPEPFSYREAAEILSAVAGEPITYRPVSPEVYKAELSSLGVPGWMGDALNDLFAQYRAGAGLRTTDVIRRISNQAPHSFSSFARDHADAFRSA
jgi:uncharacterized protein YbjT (DUF2867 family)